MYNRCPRKYFLHYILKNPIKPNIHLYRGSIVHSTLHLFEQLKLSNITRKDHPQLRTQLLDIFYAEWKRHAEDIAGLWLPDDVVNGFREESIMMLDNFLAHYIEEQIRGPPEKKTELKLFSGDEYSVMGIVDLIKEKDGTVEIIDYKTAKKADMTAEYRLQLAIYALLYEEKFNRLPSRVGIHFLKYKDGVRMIEVDEQLVNLAKREAKLIHVNTASDNPADYPCRCGGWCERDFA